MSLKNYIKQIEQLNEGDLTIAPAPSSSQIIKKDGKDIATATNPQAAAELKKDIEAGDIMLNDPNEKALGEDGGEDTALAQGMNTRQVSEELAEAFAQLESQFPHEVKMYKEGWGLDEDLYHRIAEACHGAGEVPHKVWHGDLNELRNFVENIYASHHGLVDEATLVNKGQPVDDTSDIEIKRSISQEPTIDFTPPPKKDTSIVDKLANVAKRFMPSKKDDLEEETSLERSLRASQQSKEETMFEGKETTDKGVKHTGSYGKRHGKEEVRDQYGAKIGKIDLDKEAKKDEPKRGKGRPKKDAGDAGVAFDTSELDNAFGGAAKKSAAKKLDKSHDKKKTVKHKVDEQISSWDQQLKTLLESKQINEGITVSTSMGQEQAPDSVSVSATDEDAHTLLKIIHDAGLGVKTDAREEMLKAHGMSGEGGSFSINPTDDEANDVEVVDFDTAQGDLSGEEDNGDDTLAQIKKMLGIGVDAAPEPKHPEGFDGEEGKEESGEDGDKDKDKVAVVDEEDVEEGAGVMHYKKEQAKAAGKDSFKVGDEEFPVKEEDDSASEDESKEDESKEDESKEDESKEEDKLEEGIGQRLLAGAALLAGLWGINNYQAQQVYNNSESLRSLLQYREDAARHGDKEAVAKIDQRIKVQKDRLDLDKGDPVDAQGNPLKAEPYKPVKEEHDHQTCNECGGMLEEGHDCSGQLNEWANSREGISEDERFFATVKFMTGDISGGLNGQKKDQTVMPHTAVKVIEAGDVAAQMKKLAGI
jgi:hypothetical protein